LSAINSITRDYKKDVKDPYEEAGVDIPKDLVKAYDDIYKDIAKQALGR